LNTQSPSPDAKASGEHKGPGASSHDEKAIKAAHNVATVAKQRVARKRKNRNWIQNTFGTDNQLWNLLAIVVVALSLYVVIALIAVIMKEKPEGVIEYSKPMIALLASIIAFIAGGGTRGS